MNLSPVRFHLGMRDFSRNSASQAAFGPGEKIGFWKDHGDPPVSAQENQAAVHADNKPVSSIPPAPDDIFAEHEQFAAENKQFNLDHELSKEELAILKKKYDLNHITPEDYRSLIDDLCDMGVFKAEDKSTLTTFTMLTPISWNGGLQAIGNQLARRVPEDSVSLHEVYPSADIFTWVKYRCSNEYFDPDKQDYFKTQDALLYERLNQVLDRLR